MAKIADIPEDNLEISKLDIDNAISEKNNKEDTDKINELTEKVSELSDIVKELTMQEVLQYNVRQLDNWYKLSPKHLKTKGMFLPNDTVILVKAATGADVKTFSTVIEVDRYSIEEHLNLILERCVRLVSKEVPNFNWKFLNVIDRFYLLLTVKELTFPDQKDIRMNLICPECNQENEIDFNKNNLKEMQLDDELMKFYDPDNKCFRIQEGEYDFNLYAMTLGHSLWADEYAHAEQQKGISLNNIRGDLKMCMFLTKYHTQLTNSTKKKVGSNEAKTHVQKIIDDTNNASLWPLDKILIANKYIDKIMDVFDLFVDYTCIHCNERVASHISFPRGIKSVLIPDSYLERIV